MIALSFPPLLPIFLSTGLLIFSTFGSSLAALNDTGITTCSDATQNGLPCPVAGFPGQDAEYGTNQFSFTKLHTDGTELPVSSTEQACVRDNVTGLIWEVKTDDGGLRDKDWTYTWYDPNSPDGSAGSESGGTCFVTGRCDTEKYVTDVKSSVLCGFNDWRMPTRKELESIVDFGRSNPAIDASYFPNTKIWYFWSSSPSAESSSLAWSLYFGTGDHNIHNRSSSNHVRLVRGGL
jgi:hypothetical protein